MKILAIETSCDDTGISILEIKGNKSPSFDVLSNIISSQIEVHKKYGGVYPAMAKREHQRNLVPVLMRALKQAKLLNPKSQIPNLKKIPNPKFKVLNKILEREPELYKKLISFFEKYEKPNTEGPDKREIDLIAVTNGPGLEPCLWVGVNFAKALSYFWNIPIVPINHIEAHILVNFLNKQSAHNHCHISYDRLKSDNGYLFPVIALIVSGGHTQIILMEKIGKYKILGETRDDAAGECFDKCAKILGLGYPGGPVIAKLASTAPRCRTSGQLPRPMINTKDYDFSFSGLKTAVLYHHKNQPGKIKKSKKYIQEMATEIQQAIIDVLIKKTIKAVKDYNAKTIVLGGGVSANQELRKQFKNKLEKEFLSVELFAPKPDLSTDNALMTAITGFFHQKKIKPWKNIEADGNLRIE